MEVFKFTMFVFMSLNVFCASIQVGRKNYAIATLNALVAIIVAIHLFAGE